ncbi:hypothetical protein ACRALDRAFT_1064811, partial [Sodiomyces alcalophilus JCM 7366]|uniref:uncharacterized protein n=1 Tax=Sodiomyces alcalophilus JCM 7366 TaxID=591952 RepID=UPI0039B584D0
MATKRPRSPGLIPNPFIKKRNLEWALEPPESRGHIPPVERSNEQHDDSSSTSSSDVDLAARGEKAEQQQQPPPPSSSSAAVESGRESVTVHAIHFSALLAAHTLERECPPLLPVESYRALYEANFGSPRGAHFVIHQHDHPVAGTHYDLRLQINPTSSASWAIMYGLPGDPNSARLMRNATETRVHCLWNHLIETASTSTGSLLIWDTGTYSILPRSSKHAPSVDPSSPSSSVRSGESSPEREQRHHRHRRPHQTEQEKLHAAFCQRKIRVRLDGARLPRPYVLNLRLTKSEDAQGRARAARSASSRGRTRQRRSGAKAARQVVETTSESGSSPTAEAEEMEMEGEEGGEEGEPEVPQVEVAVETKEKMEEKQGQTRGGDASQTDDQQQETVPKSNPPRQKGKQAQPLSEEMRRELGELESAQVRATNAYPGAENSIGSVHQRKWFLSLDRAACGFV